ncbi:MAG: FxsA family protein [Pseudomonadota bacterium]
MRGLFLLLIIIPIIELMVLVKVGGVIGVFPTIALLIIMGAAGIYILKRQGFSTLLRAQSRMQSGEVPARELMEGLLLAFGGLLLLIPGLISDAIAFIFLLPFVRRPLVSFLLRSGYFQAVGKTSGTAHFGQFGGGWQPGPGFRGDSRGRAFEGEFTREPSPGTPLVEQDSVPPGDKK